MMNGRRKAGMRRGVEKHLPGWLGGWVVKGGETPCNGYPT